MFQVVIQMTQIWFRSSYRRLEDRTDMVQVVIQKTGR